MEGHAAGYLIDLQLSNYQPINNCMDCQS